MSEGNGSGHLDRVEALLEKTAEKLEKIAHSVYLSETRMTRVEALHEENEERWKRNYDEQRARDEAYRDEQRTRDKALDKRIGDLVGAIGQLIERLPVPEPRR
jgi:hypothetical protein